MRAGSSHRGPLRRPVLFLADLLLDAPVVVVPRESDSRHLHGVDVRVRRYAIRTLQVPERRVWKGEVDLWLAGDPAATPVAIRVERSLAGVMLALVEQAPCRRRAGASPKSP